MAKNNDLELTFVEEVKDSCDPGRDSIVTINSFCFEPWIENRHEKVPI